MYASQFAAPANLAIASDASPPPRPSTLEGLLSAQPVEKLTAGAAAFWEGDQASHLFQIVEGCLRLYRILVDGRRAIMGFRFAGETLGDCCQETYTYTAEAVTPVRLRRISRSRIQAMTDGETGVNRLLMAKMVDEMRAAQRHIIVLGQLGAEERVIDFLVSVAHRTGADLMRPVVIDLPMTRLDIADYLGLTIETVCRTLSKLKRRGTITLQGRHGIVLHRVGEMIDVSARLDGFGETSGRHAADSCSHRLQ